MATQMELEVFRAKSGGHPRAGHLERKNNNNLESFFDFLMFTPTWITEKEREREIKDKGDEFCWENNMKILYRWWENEKC